MQLLTQSLLLKALGWALFNSLWQMALLWLLYSILILLFNPVARIRHGLALLLLAIGTVWSGVTLIGAWFFPDAAAMGDWMGWLWLTIRPVMNQALPYGSALYLLVLVGLLIRYSGHYRHSRRLTRQGLSKLPSAFRVFVAATSRQMGINRPVSAWLSSLVDVPLTLGYLKPVILLPAAMISHLTPQQVEAILVHELGHIRRKDYLLHLVMTVLEGLFFFNPFSRLLIWELKKEREHCCDDLVLQFRYDPHSYVSALLSLATRSRQTQRVAVAATGGGDQLLLQRARRILRQKEAGERPGTKPLLLLFFTLLMTLLTVYRQVQPTRVAQSGGQAQPVSRGQAPMTRIMAVANRVKTPATNAMATASAKAPAAGVLPIPHPAYHHRQPSAGTDTDPYPQAENVNMVFINTAAADRSRQEKHHRDYSLGGEPNIAAPPPSVIADQDQGQDEDDAPFVPNSSFSFQYTQNDSSGTEEKLAYLQQSARQEILAAMNQLRQELAAQIKALSVLQNKAMESPRILLQFRDQQKKMQQEYTRKLNSWQKKLDKVGHFRIVYI